MAPGDVDRACVCIPQNPFGRRRVVSCKVVPRCRRCWAYARLLSDARCHTNREQRQCRGQQWADQVIVLDCFSLGRQCGRSFPAFCLFRQSWFACVLRKVGKAYISALATTDMQNITPADIAWERLTVEECELDFQSD